MQENHLVGLRVETKSGQHLGKIIHFEVDPETQQVAKYHVASTKIVANLFSAALIIDRRQVIEITSERMVVEDLVVEGRESERSWARGLRPRRASPSVS